MKNFTYKSLLKYLFCAFLFFLANNLINNVPFAISLLPAFLGCNFSLVGITIIFCLTNLLSFSPLLSLALCLSALFLLLIYFIYKNKKATVKGELVIYLAIALLPYFLFNFQGNIYSKLAYSAIIYAFSIIFNLFIKVIFINAFKIKSDKSEKVALAISIVTLSLSLIKITSFNFYIFLALTASLLFCAFYKNVNALIPTFVLSLALSIYSADFSHIAIFEIICIIVICLINSSYFLAGISAIIIKLTISYFLGQFATFNFIDYFYNFVPTLIFLFTPRKLINYFKNNITKFGEPLLTREVINIKRAELSLKLNNLAQVFTELENTLNSFDNYILTKEDLIEKIANEVTLSTCVECAYYKQCLQKNKPNKDDLIKLINIGCNKGKVTLIDLSRDFSEYCYSATTMLTQINKLLEVYSEKTKELISVSSSKNLIQLQSHAVSEVLKQLAFEFSHKVDFNSEKEGIIFESLSTVGIVPKQILFIEDSYHLIFDKQNLLFSSIAKILSTALNENLSLTSRKDIGNKTLVTFTSAPCLDACFGIATKIKDGSAYSGDSHLLTKIDNEKFIVSLCDGMGSGENAKNNSNLAISLFENLYKIGLNEDMAVDLANKLLSVCSSENFSTLDCAIFDLHKKCASLIKLGASYGFFITQDEVRILENSSLPLGILDEISPNYYHLEVNSGDMLVMISDGISDAFFSSTDTVDFLLSNKTKNPQTLANKLLSRAIEQYGGIAKDDMTVIVIKLF